MNGKKRILLLDDSPIALELTQASLEERGYEVAAAPNHAEFRRLLGHFLPDLVLTDLEMPEVSGREVIASLKQDLGTDRIPVVLFSSRPDAELARIAAQAGADGYLSKAHGVERLGDMVDELVQSILW
ncbi:MAG TPA: response regulator [Anaeromyxobacteraceae bacterium]|nr:response regulator [Anaeromyxobacteraceae bacterium]